MDGRRTFPNRHKKNKKKTSRPKKNDSLWWKGHLARLCAAAATDAAVRRVQTSDKMGADDEPDNAAVALRWRRRRIVFVQHIWKSSNDPSVRDFFSIAMKKKFVREIQRSTFQSSIQISSKWYKSPFGHNEAALENDYTDYTDSEQNATFLFL